MQPKKHQMFIYFVFCLSQGLVMCQISNEVDVNDIEKQINEIPGLEQYNRTNLPDMEELEKLGREKCEKNGADEEAFNAFKNQKQEIQGCLEQHINFTQIQLEIEEAKKSGSMDEVFGKYCKKYPDIRKCVDNVTISVKPCLDAEEQDSLDKAVKLVDELQEFLCFKDGDRMAMFIAEGGIDCLQSKKDELQKCANETLGSRIPTDMSLNSMPRFLLTERECRDFEKIRICFNTELEKCKDSTPANIIGAFFKFLKKKMPCEADGLQIGIAAKESTSSAAVLVSLGSLIFVISVMSKSL